MSDHSARRPAHPPVRRSVRVVVLYGGQSPEHDVSCVSAAHVMRAMDRSRYEIDPIAIAPDGRWVRSPSLVAALRGSEELPASLESTGEALDAGKALEAADDGQQVVVLPVLHGPFGEDGTVQGLLELAGVPYAGSGVLGSALNMDKAMAKLVAGALGVPQVRYLSLRDTELSSDEGVDALTARVEAELGWPVFVKPANMGSSVGVSRAADPAGFRSAVAAAAEYDEWVMVEEAVTAREIEVGVLGNAVPRASVPGEIVPTHEFYDYDDKYVDGAAQMVVPADLPADVARQARALAEQTYAALRCEGLARVDFFYEETTADGGPGRGLLFNEINTMPGFTPHSMFPSLWAATGVTYSDLLDELISLALARHQHRHALRTRR